MRLRCLALPALLAACSDDPSRSDRDAARPQPDGGERDDAGIEMDAGEDAAPSEDGGGGGVSVSPVVCPGATARDYTVSTTGDDGNPGSVDQPFRTLQHAADVAGPGDVIHVRAGRYTGAESPLGYVRNSGEPGAPITFCSEEQGAAVLDGEGLLETGWYLEGSNVHVLGFEVHGFVDTAVAVYGSHAVVVGNHLHDIGRICTDTKFGKVGIYVQSEDARFERNVIHSIGRFGPDESGCSPATHGYQNHDHGVYVEGSREIRIANNLFYDHGHGWAIHVYSGAGRGTSDLWIRNNTFALANPYRDGQIILAAPSVSNVWIENNVFFQPQAEAVHFSPKSAVFSDVTVRANLTTGAVTTATAPEGTVEVVDNLDDTDAALIAPDDLDFRLGPESPAIDSGLPLEDVPMDLEGVPRPQGAGHDLGAFETHDPG